MQGYRVDLPNERLEANFNEDSRLRLTPEMGFAAMIYGAYLLPYVLVSYYVRYAIPLVPLQVLFCAWAIELAAERLGPGGAGVSPAAPAAGPAASSAPRAPAAGSGSPG